MFTSCFNTILKKRYKFINKLTDHANSFHNQQLAYFIQDLSGTNFVLMHIIFDYAKKMTVIGYNNS